MYGGSRTAWPRLDSIRSILFISLWVSVEELTGKSLLFMVSSDTIPFLQSLSCQFLLCKLTVVCQPEDSDREWKVSGKFLDSPLLKICCIHLSMAVSCFKSSLVNEMCTEDKIYQFPLHAELKACILSSHEYECPWLHLLANICKMLSCCLSMSCACTTSSVHYPDTPVLPSGTLISR